MKTFQVRLCRVIRMCAEVEVQAQTPGDAHVKGERLAESPDFLPFACEDESVEVTHVALVAAEARRKARG